MKSRPIDDLKYEQGGSNPPVFAVFRDGHREIWERAGLILAHCMNDYRARDIIGWLPSKASGSQNG